MEHARAARPEDARMRRIRRVIGAATSAVAILGVVGLGQVAPAQAAPGDPFGLQTFSNQTTALVEPPTPLQAAIPI